MKNQKFDLSKVTVSVELRYIGCKEEKIPSGINFECTLNSLCALLQDVSDIRAPLEFWFTVKFDSRKADEKTDAVPGEALLTNY